MTYFVQFQPDKCNMVTRKTPTALPPLLFGGRAAQLSDRLDYLCEQLKLSAPSIEDCSLPTGHNAVSHSSAFVDVNGLKLTALSCSPVRLQASAKADNLLLVPLVGSGAIRVKNQTLRWKAGASAVWLPRCAFVDEGVLRSMLVLNIDTNRIERVARTMLGLTPDASLEQELQAPREVLMQVGRVSFETIFRQFASVVDQFVLQPELLRYSGIDDNFYRNVAMMLHPSLFLDMDEASPGAAYARRRLDRVCQYILANLGQPLNLTDLERVGFMSRRNLHYAFQARYDCTPMQWVRQERLTLAHSHLVMSRVGTTVTDVALNCGFSKTTTFSEYYNKQFGELPSATLARALAR
jgi:AraC-like DNA-binding protein